MESCRVGTRLKIDYMHGALFFLVCRTHAERSEVHSHSGPRGEMKEIWRRDQVGGVVTRAMPRSSSHDASA